METNAPKKIASSSNSLSATTEWLEKLCQENIAFLQKSMPTVPSKRKGIKAANHLLASSIGWGVDSLEVEVDESLAVLQRLIQVYSKQLLLPGNRIEASDTSSSPATELQWKTCENIAHWINRALPVHGTDPHVAITCAGWIHGLSELGRELPAKLWIETLQSILTQIERSWNESSSSHLFPCMLWSSEAPVALATQLSKFGGKDRLVVDALERLRSYLVEVDSDPTRWLERGSRNLRALLSSVMRTRWAATKLGVRAWSKREANGFASIVEVALTFTASDGTALLCEPSDAEEDLRFWKAAIELAGASEGLVELAKCVMPKVRPMLRSFVTCKTTSKPKAKTASRKTKGKQSVFKEPGRYYEKAEIAALRRSWQHAGSRLIVDFSRDPIWVDCLGAGGRRLLSGEWDLTLSKDGQPIDLDVAWSEVCWFSDDDVDYIELEAAVENECRIQRQMVLIREEGWMLLSDTLLADHSARWRLESTWELAEGLRVRSAKKTNEAELILDSKDATQEALLLPLAMPEWRRQSFDGQLHGRDGLLVMHQEVQGKRLYSPLLIAARKSNRDQPYTWRHLTVAEDLRIQRPEVAQAFRVQVGKEQIVFYRSLAHPVRRSTLGLHLNSEFYCGRFDSDDGTYEPIVEISSD